MPYRCFETFPIHCQICGFLQLNQGHWHPLDITSVRLRSFHGGCYIWEFGDHLLLKDESQRTVADDRTNAAIGENVDHLIQTWQDRNRELSLYENITRTRTPLYDDDSVYCKNCRCSEEQHNAWTQENAGVVQLDYWNSGRCMWYIGSKAVLKDQKLDMDVGHEEAAIKYVRKHTTIPVPRWVRCWQESGRALLFMERLPGQPLQEAQLRRVLDEDTVAIIKDEIVGYLGQLRKLQAPKPGSPDGHQIRSLPFRRQDTKIRWLLPPTHEEAKEDWYQKSLSGVGPSHLSKLNELKLNFPASEPYTFTHGYLNGSNVMVYEGRVSGIIDWELSGFAPFWWEGILAKYGYSVHLGVCKTPLRWLHEWEQIFATPYQREVQVQRGHSDAWLKEDPVAPPVPPCPGRVKDMFPPNHYVDMEGNTQQWPTLSPHITLSEFSVDFCKIQ